MWSSMRSVVLVYRSNKLIGEPHTNKLIYPPLRRVLTQYQHAGNQRTQVSMSPGLSPRTVIHVYKASTLRSFRAVGRRRPEDARALRGRRSTRIPQRPAVHINIISRCPRQTYSAAKVLISKITCSACSPSGNIWRPRVRLRLRRRHKRYSECFARRSLDAQEGSFHFRAVCCRRVCSVWTRRLNVLSSTNGMCFELVARSGSEERWSVGEETPLGLLLNPGCARSGGIRRHSVGSYSIRQSPMCRHGPARRGATSH
ncbi:hypothetical protein BC628DRAFT_1027324 [Trametes gibbosa]|nr:hypothetical protein BC628DRAFT_1027324 [Trametes gibbosa]